MAMDLTSVLLGLAAAALPLLVLAWQLQRRASTTQADVALLQERLAMAQLAQDGLNAQLESSRDEAADLTQANAAKQADLAALRRLHGLGDQGV
jgi:DNA recombination protein RmuC